MRILLAVAFLAFAQGAYAVDVKRAPLWDGETSDVPDGALVNRYGGPVVHGGATKTTVSRVIDVVRSGSAAYRVDLTGTLSDFAFFQLALAGFGPTTEYVMTRDLRHFEKLTFYVRNGTGAPFTLKLEIKDHRDSSAHSMFQRFAVPADAQWHQLEATLRSTTGWTVVGQPDLRRAKVIGFVIEVLPGQPLSGFVHVDDVVLVEPGAPLESATAPVKTLVEQLAHRQFDALWGSRSAVHGLVPLNSVFGNVAALNSTAALVKLLPIATERQWVARADVERYVTTLSATLHRLMDEALYLPPRYVDWVTLAPTYVREESPADAGFLALALHQYAGMPNTPAQVAARARSVLRRMNFAAFGSPRGWRLAYRYDTSSFSTNETYDGYSGEVWCISLAAHLMPRNRVPIARYFHTANQRVRASCTSSPSPAVVHADQRFRAPFLQWLFPIFVRLNGYRVDSYPVRSLATNPLDNAISYQRDVHRSLAAAGRAALLQLDAGDDGSGHHYEQYSCFEDFGEPDLLMPWSAPFSLMAEPAVGAAALRRELAQGLHGPLGLSDSARWAIGASRPHQVTARHDFWNLSLSTMAMTSYLYGDNAFLTRLPEVKAALAEMYP